MFTIEESLGKLARRIPGATAVFREHDLDFCCGGNKSLRAAAEERGLDAARIEEELQAVVAARHDQERDWSQASPRELIDHILTRFHAVHRQQYPEAVRLARKVEQAHGARPDCPHGLGDQLQFMQDELEMHMRKEEMVLFPALLKGIKGAAVQGPIFMMMHEHESHGEGLQRVLQLTNDLTLPRDACVTWRALYLALRTLREDLMFHIHLENNILFADALEGPAASQASPNC